MRILLLYDNFIRDYRGLLLLSAFLKQKGNKVWIKAHWNDPFSFCTLHNVQALVTGQIAEWTTHYCGKFCADNNILLIINTSEPVTSEENFELLITYNTSESNQDIIDLQSIGISPHFKFIQSNSFIKEKNKLKYKFLGFPRTDISYHHSLRQIEEQNLVDKYNLNRFNKKYLFLSSFLVDATFVGVPEQDLIKWDYTAFQQRTIELLTHTTNILKKFIKEKLGDNDILIIKKHPWDCSSYFRDNFCSEKCLILDNIEFITPCLSASDIIIHTYSTAAFEAWIMGKPTVSIYLEKYLNIVPYHMRKEKIAYDYESFIKIIEEQAMITSYNDEDLFSGKLDGNATYRIANEISKLTPKRRFSIKMNPRFYYRFIKSIVRYYLIDFGLKKYDIDKMAEKNTKQYDFLIWENQRGKVNKIYRPVLRNYVRKFLSHIKFD